MGIGPASVRQPFDGNNIFRACLGGPARPISVGALQRTRLIDIKDRRFWKPKVASSPTDEPDLTSPFQTGIVAVVVVGQAAV
jgi:hypothetical protein